MDDELRALQRGHYERRVAFDRYFADGESFRYGAVNTGGPGAIYYGKFCVVLARELLHAWRWAFLPGNSLELYVKSPPHVDEASIRRDVAPATGRQWLAVLKHADELDARSDDEWPGMLCSSECFIESIFVDEVTPEQVEVVRIEQRELDRLYDMAFDDLRVGLDASERAEAENFLDVLELSERAQKSDLIQGVGHA